MDLGRPGSQASRPVRTVVPLPARAALSLLEAVSREAPPGP
jgi:hypothetical protein